MATRGRSVQRGEAWGKESPRVAGVVEHQARLLLREGEGSSAQQMMVFYSSREISLTLLLLLPLVSQGEFCHINTAGRRDGNHAADTHLPNFCLFDVFFFFFSPETRVQMKCFLYFILSATILNSDTALRFRDNSFFVVFFFFLSWVHGIQRRRGQCNNQWARCGGNMGGVKVQLTDTQ